ncbi:carbohydrate porin [Paraburkholderia sp. LEh10]|jgi:porin|uniref:carbohydrate porin n=1 Tax=Paraburkholderia sp. LEh10 TaxID=2821353 RepID=UPI001AE2E780|nr:carbohydrate porin [Paraburkholderia sp. LEh10]MBP0595728.1 carbohydrate porin [Paraburkholderia sp. LEh10]
MSTNRFGVFGFRHPRALRLSAIAIAVMLASGTAFAQTPNDASAVSESTRHADAQAAASSTVQAGAAGTQKAASSDAKSAPASQTLAQAGDTLRQASTDRPTVHQGIPSTDELGVSHVGNATPEPAEGPRQGPLSSIGQKINDWGFTPVLNLVQMYLTNPSVGQQTGNHEALTFVSIGGDFDLQKIAGFNGATIHFQQLFVPFTHNLGWGTQVGDVLAGQPGPYVPKVSHLTLFTWEQKAFHDRLDVELGKSNPGLYFGAPVCNQGFGCQSVILQDSAGMNPPIYANWGGRVRYSLTPEWSVQAGVWRSNPAFPFTNGWEWTDSASDSNTWLANAVYRTTYEADPFPKSYELMLYYSTRTQTDPLTQSTHKGTSGLYFGGRQVVYRPDGGKAGVSSPTALSVYATSTVSFDAHASTGLGMTGATGLILEAPFRSRPHDSYSLSFLWATLTPHEQEYLKEQNLAAGGTGYTVGRTQYGLKLDANIAVGRSIILSPYVMRTWNTNTWGNPVYAGTPKNGFVAGVLASIFFDKMLGLTDH